MFFGSNKEVVDILREQVATLEAEKNFWRDKYMGLKEAPKQEAKPEPPTKEVGTETKADPIEALSLALARGGGLQAPSKLTAWRAVRTAEHRREKVALATGPLERIEG